MSSSQDAAGKPVDAVSWQAEDVNEHIAGEVRQSLCSKRAAQSRRLGNGFLAYFVSVNAGRIAVLVHAAEKSLAPASVVDSPHAGASAG